MKASEFRQLIREEVRKVLKEAKESKNPEEIMEYFKNAEGGTYLFAGNQANLVHQQFRGQSLDKKLTPIFYTAKLTNITNLINSFPKYKKFTIADISKGEIDVRVVE